MLKIKPSYDHLIFNMGIPIPGKAGLYIEIGPSLLLTFVRIVTNIWIEVSRALLYPRFNQVDRGVYWYHLVRMSVCPSVRLSVCPSVDRIVFVLFFQQYSSELDNGLSPHWCLSSHYLDQCWLIDEKTWRNDVLQKFHQYLYIFIQENALPYTRLLLSCSRKIGKVH